jgi:UPF0271 protein
MGRTIEMALRHGVAIGAHPGFADRENFGRKEIVLPPGGAGRLVLGQVAALERIAASLGARVGHVKLHGSLYNMAARDEMLAMEISDALRKSGGDWILVGLAGSRLISAGRALGLRVAEEAFADRLYRSDGSLSPRSEKGAVISEVSAAVRQAVRIAAEGRVTASDGADVELRADTLCIHGDSPGAVEFAARIRGGLSAAGISVRPLG